jgi:DNA-binding SARP family transcriptional activator/tetratricopeptide (TPR) repeat protein
MPGHILQLRLLGSPQLIYGGQTLNVPRRQARAFLYRLGPSPGPVSRDALMQLLWPDSSDPSARRRLTRLLSYVRGTLPNPEAISADPSAVWLVSDLAKSDALAFASLVGAGTESALEEAVALVRGPFLDGFALPESSEFDLWLTTMQQHYERQYLAVLAELVALKAAAANYEAAIQYAQLYLQSDELAEDIHRQLITLFAANGQRSAALLQFERCMVVLERELGVEPLPKTRAVYEAARDGLGPLPEPEDTGPVWATLPGLDLTLVGREDSWSELVNAYHRFRHGGVILISGVPGVGKSRLMQEFAPAQHALVLTGNSHSAGQTVAYQPLVQALRQALAMPLRWQHTAPIWLAEASRLLPELPARFPGLPPPVDVEAQQAQARLYEGLTNVFLGLATDGSVLLCLDDIHWADEATLGWLQYATARLPGSGLCMLATLRSDEASRLDPWRRSLSRAKLFATVDLHGLTTEAVAALLHQVDLGEREPESLASRLQTSTGGNAFFLMETLRGLLEAGRGGEVPDDPPLPPAVRETVLRRVGRLTPLARQVLEVAAVLSPRLSLDLIGQVAGRDQMRTADSLEELTGRSMLVVEGGGFRFQHDLARKAVYGNISAWRRQLLHGRAADALAGHTAKQDDDLAEIAFHFQEAGRWLKAVEYYWLAADGAQRVYARQEAVAYLERAIALAEEAGSSPIPPVEIHEALGDNLRFIGEFVRSEAAYRWALAALPEPDPLRRAGLEAKLAATLAPQERADEAEQTFRAALARLVHPPAEGRRQWQTARLDILLGLLDALYFRMRSGPMEELVDLTAELLNEVGSVGQKSGFLSRLNRIAFIENRYCVPDESIGRAEEAVALARVSGNAWFLARQQFHLGFQRLWHGDSLEATELLAQSAQAAEALGDCWLRTQSLVYLVIAYRFQGSTEAVAALADELWESSQQIGNNVYIGASQANRAWLHYRAEEWRQAASLAEEAVSTWQLGNYPLQWLAHWIVLAAALHDGRLQRASEAARAMLEPTQQPPPGDMAGLLGAALASWDLGDRLTAREGMVLAVNLARQNGYL